MTKPWEHSLGRFDELWTSLYKRGRFVGFRKQIAGRFFYSPDGYVWQGKEIPFDQELGEVGIRDRTDRRVFHGDWVLLPEQDGEEATRKVVILQHPRWGILCWEPIQDQLLPVFEVISASERPTVVRVLGSIHRKPEMTQRAEHALSSYRPFGEASKKDVLEMTCAISAGAVLTGFTQSVAFGAVRPVFIGVAMLLCIVGLLTLRRWFSPAWFVRRRLWSLAQKSSFVVSVLLALACTIALLMKIGGLEESASPVLLILGSSVVGWVASFVSIIVTGKLIMWVARK